MIYTLQTNVHMLSRPYFIINECMYVVQLYVSQYVLNNIGHTRNDRGKKEILAKATATFYGKEEVALWSKGGANEGGSC